MANGKDLHLYQIIRNDIQKLMLAEDFDYDKPICTEKSLCEQYGVSRITAKRALSELEYNGVIYRKRGVGSFAVKPLPINHEDVSGRARNKVFALLIPFGIANGGIFRAIEAASVFFNRHNCQLSLHVSESNVSRERDMLEQLHNQNIDGLVYYPWTSFIPADLLECFTESGIPVIVLDKICSDPSITTIVCDNYRGSYALTEHIASYGHQKTCYLSRFSPEQLSSVHDRFAGYSDCLRDNGIEIPPRFVQWESAADGGYPMLKHIVSGLYKDGTTAILCENDEVAFNVYMCCRSIGLHMPDDMSIAGFDNIDWATMGSASITTVDQNFAIIGETIANTLLSADYSPKRHTVPVKLVPRTSTGKAVIKA